MRIYIHINMYTYTYIDTLRDVRLGVRTRTVEEPKASIYGSHQKSRPNARTSECREDLAAEVRKQDGSAV